MPWPWSPPAPSPRDSIGTPRPRRWWRRNLPALTAVLVVVLGAGVWYLHPWNPCGKGLILGKDGQVCAGLDVNTSGFTSNDGLSDLRKIIFDDNHAITGPNFVTIVYLDDLNPDSSNDSVNLRIIRHSIEGAITAQQTVNTKKVNIIGPETPKIRLLLANYGRNANDWRTATNAIEGNEVPQHIVAVTGVGESLVNTKRAIEDLSAKNITTVGSVASGDNMNVHGNVNGTPIQNFYRVTSTNDDEAGAAVSYINQNYQSDKKVMLVQDRNPEDNYTKNLGDDFKGDLEQRDPQAQIFNEPYESHSMLVGEPRSLDVNNQFSDMRAAICDYIKPNLIYFAGRGVDLKPFLQSLDQGECPLGHLTLLSADDLNSVTDSGRLPSVTGTDISIFYTAVATDGEWKKDTQDRTESADYDIFQNDYTAIFPEKHLGDGHAIMEYDAFLTAGKAARNDHGVIKNPDTLSSIFPRFDCLNNQDFIVPGASGQIAFYRNGSPPKGSQNPPVSGQGNPIDKPIPIMQLNSDGTVTQRDMEWSEGHPFDDVCPPSVSG